MAVNIIHARARASAIIMVDAILSFVYYHMRVCANHSRVSLALSPLYRPLYLHINELFRGYTAQAMPVSRPLNFNRDTHGPGNLGKVKPNRFNLREYYCTYVSSLD